MVARENPLRLRAQLRYALLSAGAVILAAQTAMATTYTWTNGDANALWDTTSHNWTTGAGNIAFVSDNTTPNSALFIATSATPGVVSVTGTTSTTPILTSGITFNEAGWSLSGGFLSGATSTADGTIAISNTGNNTINTAFVNNTTFKTALSITGVGTLSLGGASTNTGGTTVTGTGGTTKVLVTSTSGVNAQFNPLVLDGGTLVGGVTYANNSIKIGPGGAYFDTNAGSTVSLGGSVTINDVTPGTGGGLNFVGGSGVVNWNGGANFTGDVTNTTGTLNISSVKTYTGNTILAGASSQIRLGGSDFLPATTTVVISASNQGFQLRGFNQTVAGIDSAGVINNNRFVAQANGSGMGGTIGSTITVSGTSTFGGQIRDGSTNAIGGGFTTLHKTVGGNLTLNNGSLYTGGTIIDAGTITMGHTRALSGPGAVGQQAIYASGQTPGVVTVNAAGSLDLGGQQTYQVIKLNGGTLGNSSANPAAVLNGVYAVSFGGPGSDFQIPNTVTITGGGGTGTVLTPYFALTTASIQITSPGTGYTSAPSISFTGSNIGNGSGSTTLSGGGVATVNITNGGVYNNLPTAINFTAPPAGGTAPTATFVNGTYTLLGFGVTTPGSGYTSAPSVSLQGTVGTTTAIMSAVTLQADSSIGGDNGDINLEFQVDGPGGLNKIGGNVVRLNGNNTYTGSTNVNAGTLLVNGNNTASTFLNLNAGTLGGTGTLTQITAGPNPHTIAPSATLAAGATATLNTQALTTNANTTLAFRLVTPNTAGGSDMINVTGSGQLNVISGGTLAITANPVGLGSLGYYKAIQYAGNITGNYTSIARPATDANKIVYTLDIAHDAGFVDIHRGFEGDANDDGLVNFADFVRVSNNYGLADKGWFGGDFNGDGITNFADFVKLSNNYGNTVSGSAIVVSPDEWAALSAFGAAAADAVPEPASLALLGVGAAALMTKRRRK